MEGASSLDRAAKASQQRRSMFASRTSWLVSCVALMLLLLLLSCRFSFALSRSLKSSNWSSTKLQTQRRRRRRRSVMQTANSKRNHNFSSNSLQKLARRIVGSAKCEEHNEQRATKRACVSTRVHEAFSHKLNKCSNANTLVARSACSLAQLCLTRRVEVGAEVGVLVLVGAF